MPTTKDLKTLFYKMDKEAFRDLSNNGVIVYLAFVKVYPEIDPDNLYMAKQARMSLGTYKKAKAELIEHGYLCLQRHGAKGAKITYYFGKKAVGRHKKNVEMKKKKEF